MQNYEKNLCKLQTILNSILQFYEIVKMQLANIEQNTKTER